jgi:hypothetical protein
MTVPPSDEAPTIQYAQVPAFASYPIIVTSSIAVQRAVDSVSLYAFIHHYHLITPQTVGCSMSTDDDDVELPISPQLARVALTTDHTVIGVDPATPLELTFDTDGTAPGVSYHALLQRVVGDQLVIERAFYMTSPRLLIDPAILEPGAQYIFQLTAYTGLPDAGSGDFRDLHYPYSFGDLMTPIFSVSK